MFLPLTGLPAKANADPPRPQRGPQASFRDDHHPNLESRPVGRLKSRREWLPCGTPVEFVAKERSIEQKYRECEGLPARRAARAVRGRV